MEIVGFIFLILVSALCILHALVGIYIIYSFSGIFKWGESLYITIVLIVGLGLGYMAINNAPFTLVLK